MKGNSYSILSVVLTALIFHVNIFADDPEIYKLPSGPDGPGTFGAYYANLKYDPVWDAPWRIGNHPDIVVRFDDGGHKFVFWRGTSYIPCWVTDTGVWYTNEFVERRGVHCSNTEGCIEPMSDKQCRYSQVRVIESNEARVVVHWRYAPVDVHYEHAFIDQQTGWFDWVDEYYVIYPNASGVRDITVQTNGINKWTEFQEAIVVNQPGTLPHDNVEAGAISVANMDGEHKTYFWDEDGGPAFDSNPPNSNIMTVNLKAEKRPYALVVPPTKGENLITSYRGHGRNSIFNWWDHWPVSQDASDGRGARSAERPSHSSLAHIGLPKDHVVDIWGTYGYATEINVGVLSWTSTEWSGVNFGFEEEIDMSNPVTISFDYAGLWTSDIYLQFHGGRRGATEEITFDNSELILNDSNMNTFTKKINLNDFAGTADLAEIEEGYLQIKGSEESRTWKIDNLTITSDDGTQLFVLNFDLPDGSTVEDIKYGNKAEWEPYELEEKKVRKLMLHGMSGKPIQDLVPLAKSWIDPAELKIKSSGFENQGYDPSQLAYVIEQKSDDASSLEIEFAASSDSPMVNPAFVIKGWDKNEIELKINNELKIRGEDYRCAIQERLDGTDLILWLNMDSTEPVKISLSYKTI